MAQLNETSSDDDEEYEDSGMGLGFIFGNVDNSGDLDADYLDEDAKEHLSALASSLPDIISLANSENTTSDPAEQGDVVRQDYDRKAEDAVDCEDIDEEYDEDYDESEVQVVSEEDHVLPKREYFSAAVALSSLNSKAFVFDDDDYDEEEEQEEHTPVEKAFDSEEREPVFLKEDKTLEYEKKGTILENEAQMDTEDVREGEVDELLEGSLNEKRATSLPTLYVEDGMVILQFSEIFAIHEPPRKRSKRENRYITYRVFRVQV
ncbi:unnamed protein product [Arabis nemorensis]|uniref:TAFII-230 TBP-binding domain-containing protein n=1 Tax=Arabis nemorensis TaxID=586526 RepID=A0A565AZR7_9BRAS|nr:unnamed protein product [Arabis nemorensis]